MLHLNLIRVRSPEEMARAAADMFERTNTDYAPWYVIATDDKNTARVEVLKAILKQLKAD